jgi:ankyrin repeat protein
MIENDDEDAGNTPLHVACKWNQMDLVEFFYEIGGENLVKIKNKDGLDSI